MKGWKDERMKVSGRYILKDERMIKNIYIKGWKSEWMKPHKQITEP